MRVDKKNAEEFCKNVRRFARDNNVSAAEMRDLLREMWEDYDKHCSGIDDKVTTLNEFHNGIDKDDIADFRKMWDGFVNQTIEYINSHENIKKAIDGKKDEVTEKWDEDEKQWFMPDIRMYFSADGIDGSLEYGEWTAATDSAITLAVGNHPLICGY